MHDLERIAFKNIKEISDREITKTTWSSEDSGRRTSTKSMGNKNTTLSKAWLPGSTDSKQKRASKCS